QDHNPKRVAYIASGRESGGYTHRAALVTPLPTVSEVSTAKSLDDLQKLFGKQQGWTDAWGDGSRIHWSEGWTFFTLETNHLRYLNIFALVSSENKAPAIIDSLSIKEGIFNPANPRLKEEATLFKTPDQIEKERQEALKADRARRPQPLRRLLEAEQAPD